MWTHFSHFPIDPCCRLEKDSVEFIFNNFKPKIIFYGAS